MDNEYQNVVLAALLHDIGKFYQRAGFKLDVKSSSGDAYDFTAYTRKSSQGRYTHVHAAYTAKFFREYLPNSSSAEVLAALHHVPENANNNQQRFLASLITLADRMSSGERQDRNEEEESGKPQEEPLTSIFSLIVLKGEGGKEYYQPLTALEPSVNSFFPVESKAQAFGGTSGEAAYRKLWEKFTNEFRKLNRDDILQIYYLLQKYTLSIPAAVYRDKPDISLFHHLKTTSALAACLFHLYQAGQLDENKIKQVINSLVTFKDKTQQSPGEPLQQPDFLLIGGDISGIQEFIYQVTSERALKGLRARSFYLQVLSEIMARKVLHEFNLSEVNLLYCGGGNFYLILPNINRAEEKLNIIQRETDEILLRAHKGKLAAILSWIPVCYQDFFYDFARLWDKLGAKLQMKKRKKFASLAELPETTIFQEIVLGPFDTGGQMKGCQICGEEITEEKNDICSLCESFIDFSNELLRATSVLLEPQAEKPLPRKDLTWQDVIEALGFRFKFSGPYDKEARRSLVINSTDFAGKYRGFVFVARKARTPQGKILTLEDLAKAATGIQKWGVLRADVDRLGELFSRGLGKNKTISRVSTLSSMLSLYFSARMSQLENLGYNKDVTNYLTDHIYLAYSGGDDLFLIGPWSTLPDLANIIYNDFRKFTCQQLTLSAGIFFSPSKKFPIYQAAELAGEAEDKAKNEGRDRLTIFGETLPWACYSKVKEIISLVTSLIDGKNGGKVPRSLINVLYNVYLEKELKKKVNPNNVPLERIWRFHYSLKKLMAGLDESQRQDLLKLLNLVIINYEISPCLNIATRVADYLTRKGKEATNELS